MNRRSFLLGLVAAPAVIAVDRLMPVKVWGVPDASYLGECTLSTQSAIPTLWGDGVHDDTAGLRALLNGLPVDCKMERIFPEPAAELGCTIPNGTFLISDSIELKHTDEQFIRRDVMIAPHFTLTPEFPADKPLFDPERGSHLIVMGANIQREGQTTLVGHACAGVGVTAYYNARDEWQPEL